MKADHPYFLSASFFVASFALRLFDAMFILPEEQVSIVTLLAWILAGAATILFFTGLIKHKHK